MALTTALFMANMTSSKVSKTNGVNGFLDDVRMDSLTKSTVIVKCVTLAVLIVFFSFGNVTVIYGIIRTPDLRNKSNTLIASLLMTDTATALSGILFIAYQVSVYVVSKNPCAYIVFIGIASAALKVFPHALNGCYIAISLDRFIAIVYPYFYQEWINASTIRIFIVGPWIFGGLISIIFFQYLRFVDWSGCLMPCSEFMQDLVDLTTYLLVSSIMILSYGKILVIAKQHHSKITATRDMVKNPGSHPDPDSSEFKAARMTAMILAAYLILWFPYRVGRCLHLAGRDNIYIQYLLSFGMPLGHFNSGLNWFIYGVYNKNFRQTLMKLLSKRKLGSDRSIVKMTTKTTSHLN